MIVYCPYADCGFTGTDDQVDEHRTSGTHNDEPQAGSNLRQKPEWRLLGNVIEAADQLGIEMGEVYTHPMLAMKRPDDGGPWEVWSRS